MSCAPERSSPASPDCLERYASLLLLAVQVAFMGPVSRPAYMGFRDIALARREDISRLQEFVRDSDGPVLADETLDRGDAACDP
ncbi:MAG TPA: hypothetical protein VFJ72_09195 [Rubrobacteraceae bacterium]|nr:hypothetical protein [Rubrobacteraceae bacterium]